MVKTAILVLMMISFPSLPVMAGEMPALHAKMTAQAYILQKVQANDLVFMGTTHKQPAILDLLANLLPTLRPAGVTHLALEIDSEEQSRIDTFLASGAGLETIRLHAAIDCPAYRRLLRLIATLPPSQRPLIRALDLPVSAYSTGTSRDQWMATQLLGLFQEVPQAKIVAVMGSMHVLRKLDWQPRIGTGQEAIRSRLQRRLPSLSIFSILNIVGDIEPHCDFALRLGKTPGAVAMDLDEQFADWTLGLTRCIALRPAKPHELADGVIVY